MAKVKMENMVENLAGRDQERDKRILDYVLTQVRSIRNARAHLERQWLIMERIYRGDPISRWFPTDDSTHINEPFKMVEAAVPRVMQAALPGDNWFRLRPKGEASVDPWNAKQLMLEQFEHGRLYSRFEHFVRNMAKFGFAAAKVPWRRDRRTVTVREPITEERFTEQGERDGFSTRVRREEQEVDRDRTELVPLSLFDFYVDWSYDDIQQAPGCGDASMQTKEEVYAKMNTDLGNGSMLYQGITREEVEQIGLPAPRPALDGKDLQRAMTGADQIERLKENNAPTFEWWGAVDLGPGRDGSGEREEAHITILDEKFVVHESKNNLWHCQRPYLACPWIPAGDEQYGIGLIEPIVRHTLDLNDNQNAINAGTALSVNPMVKAGDKFNIPDQQLVVAPGRVLRGEDVAQLQPFVLPDMSDVSRRNKEDLRREIEETDGIPRMLFGAEDQSETATQSVGRRNAANMRLSPVVRRLNQDVLQPLLDMCLYNNQQFMEERRGVRFDNRAGEYRKYQVTPKELASIARVEAVLAPQIELLGVRGQMMQNFMAAIAQLGPLAGQQPYRSLLRTAWINQFGYEDIEKVFPEEVQRKMTSQREENLLMMMGEYQEVRDYDNHDAHIAEIVELYQSGEWQKLSPRLKAIINAHLANHEMKRRLAAEAQQQVPAIDLEGLALERGGAGGGKGVPRPAPEQLEGVAAGRMLAEEQRKNIQ